MRTNFKPSSLQAFKPSKLLILLLAALALCTFAGCAADGEDSYPSISQSNLNSTTWVATAFASNSNNSSVQVTVTLTFASGSWQMEFAIDGTTIATQAGTYSITNYDYQNPRIRLSTSSSTLMTLTYNTSSLEGSLSLTIYDSSNASTVLAEFSSVSLIFSRQTT